jgi:hypothetical protein
MISKNSSICFLQFINVHASRHYAFTCFLMPPPEERGKKYVSVHICKLQGIRRESERERWPLCLRKEDAKRVLLKCSETSRGEKYLYTENGWVSRRT